MAETAALSAWLSRCVQSTYKHPHWRDERRGLKALLLGGRGDLVWDPRLGGLGLLGIGWVRVWGIEVGCVPANPLLGYIHYPCRQCPAELCPLPMPAVPSKAMPTTHAGSAQPGLWTCARSGSWAAVSRRCDSIMRRCAATL